MNAVDLPQTQYQLNASGHRGTAAVQRLVEYAPATGALALWMQHRDVDALSGMHASTRVLHETQAMPIANDGHTLFYTPRFETLHPEEQCALVAHQVLHVALRHAARIEELQSTYGEVDVELFTACADAIVNASLSHLSWMRLPKNSICLDHLLLRVLGIEEAVDVSLHRWDTETLYRAIDDRKHGGSQHHSSQASKDSQDGQDSSIEDSKESLKRRDGPRAKIARQQASGIFQDLLPDSTQQPEAQAEQIRQWSERLTRAHAADGEQSLLRQLLADRPQVKTPWEHHLRTRMNRSLSAQAALSWSRPTRSWIACQGRTSNGRRLPWQPGITAFKEAPRLCIIADVSGSIDDALMTRFSNEIDRLLRVHRCDTRLIIGDDQVRHTMRLKPGCIKLRELSFNGGGGTDFRPLLAAAARGSPDLVIVLSDLDGPAGEACPFPVIWAVTPGGAYLPAPFGIRIQLTD